MLAQQDFQDFQFPIGSGKILLTVFLYTQQQSSSFFNGLEFCQAQCNPECNAIAICKLGHVGSLQDRLRGFDEGAHKVLFALDNQMSVEKPIKLLEDILVVHPLMFWQFERLVRASVMQVLRGVPLTIFAIFFGELYSFKQGFGEVDVWSLTNIGDELMSLCL